MRLISYCIAVCAVALTHSTAAGGGSPPQASAPVPGESAFSVFLAGKEIGREQTNLARSGSDWIITATSRIGPPIDLTVSRFELKYSADWQPIELKVEARMQQAQIVLSTSFGLTTAINEITQNGVTNSKTDQVSARTIVLPNNFYAAYEGLAARLAGLTPGSELVAYVAPQREIKITLRTVTSGQFQTTGGVVRTTRYGLTFHNPGGAVEAEVSTDDSRRLARLEIPAASLVVARRDLASVSSRTEVARNPTDTDVTIPSAGFNLAGTVTTPPAAAGRMRSPTVLLVAGSGDLDRDAVVAGIPLFAQLAGGLAERGFLVVRYDKRGLGQSGGRTETVTLQDYAEDVVAAVKWLARRKDVDSRRIAVIGHSEGGAMAMLAAAREKKIASVVLMAAMGTRGVDLILEQQRYSFDLLKVPDQERPDKVELQKKILEAAVSGKGLDELPPDIRARIDTPWYRSLLLFDPARVMPRVKQPVLILHGALDREILPHHAQRLEELANTRKKAPPAAVVQLPGLNHLLVPATTGDITEYASLPEKRISAEVARAVAEWLAAPGVKAPQGARSNRLFRP